MAPIEPKPIITNQNFIKKISWDAKVSLCQHDPMKSFYSHDLFYSYILMQIIWLGLKESYHTTTTFFFFFFFFLIRVYQDLGIWVLSAIGICLRIFVFLFRSLRHFVKHLGLAYFHKGYQFLYHSLTIILAKHEKEKELQREKARKLVNLSNKIGFWITYERLCMFWIKGRSFIYKIK